jgi:hypothetical protein
LNFSNIDLKIIKVGNNEYSPKDSNSKLININNLQGKTKRTYKIYLEINKLSQTAEKNSIKSQKVCNNFYNLFNPEIQYNFNVSNGHKEEMTLRAEKSSENIRIFPRNEMEKYSSLLVN